MTTRTYSPPHPIVFVFDFSNKNAEVPEYDSQAVASSNESAISIRTIADVDGDVTVTLARTLPTEATEHGVEVFCGAIDAPSRKVAVITSHNEQLLETDVAERKAAIRVFVDDKTNPSRIWVEAR